MILLQLNNVARYFADVTLFENVSFNIQTQDRIALVGRNGTGKSTLIKQIIGQEPLSNGEITRAKDISIGYLEQHVTTNSELTIWEEMLSVFEDTLALREKAENSAQLIAELADQPDSDQFKQAIQHYDTLQEELNQRNAYAIESDIRTVLHGFRFYEEDYDLPVNSLSGGQKTRLALAQILLMKHDLLILDEPTNHLDMDTLRWLEGYLQNYRGALLIVSHDRYFLNRVANQVVELRHHTSHIYKGNYDYYMKEKEARLEQEIQAYEKQQAEIDKLEDFVQRNIVRASTTKRAQSRRKQLEKMDRIERPKQDDKSPRINFSSNRQSGDRVLEAIQLAIGYPDSEIIAKDINFDLRRQEAIAVVGPNGVGKTTLLKTLIHQLDSKAGEVLKGTNVDIGYYDQNINQLDPKLTVLETLWRAHDNTDEWRVRSILGSFLFTGETVDKKVSLLSGGEKARLSLALLATNHDNTLLLDEPTNHLDIDSKEVLENALIEFDGTLFFVSHDRYFINRIATKVLEITPEKSTLFYGDYDYYLEKKAELEEVKSLNSNKAETSSIIVEKEKNDGQLSYQAQKDLQRERRQLQKAVELAEENNASIEAKIEKLEADMITANESGDSVKLMDLHKEFQEIQEQQNQALDDWESASISLEAFYEDNPTLL
ncbi:ABC-F family ATP-binding cassette domain-containing protein [Aerococcaceae bacterium DSM 111022]|nr:ABC-F family ATP-binding cassette domain-containing protein [Aerococcaceae bacterium DSM 111022]